MEENMFRSLTKKLFPALLALVVPALLGGALAAAEISPAAIKARGKLVVATSSGAMPFEMTDKNGGFMGFDIDIARALGKDLGVQVEFQNYAFSGLIPAILANKVDLALSDITRTDKRKEVLDFSEPYYKSGQVMLVSKALVPSASKWQDFDKQGYVVAVSLGTTADLIASQIFKHATVKRFDGNALARMEVRAGRAHVLINETAPVKIFALQNPKETYAILEPFTTEDICIAVPKGNKAMVDYLNAFMKKFMASKEFKASEHKWFDTIAWFDDVKK
jgi:polar amino acid transport system substrate-binding protein